MYQDLPHTGLGAAILTLAAVLLSSGAALLRRTRRT